MTAHDFSVLLERYPSIILPARFTSHQFIHALAQEQQPFYIEALYAYRHAKRADKAAPFQVVHGVLAQNLERFSELVHKLSSAVPSTDMFGHANTAAQWARRVISLSRSAHGA